MSTDSSVPPSVSSSSSRSDSPPPPTFRWQGAPAEDSSNPRRRKEPANKKKSSKLPFDLDDPEYSNSRLLINLIFRAFVLLVIFLVYQFFTSWLPSAFTALCPQTSQTIKAFIKELNIFTGK